MADHLIAFLGTSGIGGHDDFTFLKYHCRIGLLLHNLEVVSRRWMVTPYKGAGDAVMMAAATLLEEFSGQTLTVVTREDSALGYFKELPFKTTPTAYEHLLKLRDAKALGPFTICRPETCPEPKAPEYMRLAQKEAHAGGTLETTEPGIWHPSKIKLMDKPGDGAI